MMTTRREVYEHYPFVAVGVIIEQDGKILLVQEGGVQVRGQWNIPAGWLDKGENPVEAAKREGEEETGLKLELTNFLGVYSSVAGKDTTADKLDRHCIGLTFVARIVGGKLIPPPEEIFDARWFMRAEIEAMAPGVIRNLIIKNEVRDYFAGKRYPLEIVQHYVAA